MNITLGRKLVLLALACAFSIGLVGAVQKPAPALPGHDSLVEVAGNRVAYVPRTAQYVKYNGKVREIVRFASALSPAEQDCKCPKCCDGYCFMIIYTDSVLPTGPVILLAVIWIKC